MMIMFLITLSSSVGSIMSCYLAVWRLFDSDVRYRQERLQKRKKVENDFVKAFFQSIWVRIICVFVWSSRCSFAWTLTVSRWLLSHRTVFAAAARNKTTMTSKKKSRW